MSGNRIGALKGHAKRFGFTETDYLAEVSAGNKWCGGCKRFHPASEFPPDGWRESGLSSICKASRNTYQRTLYADHGRTPRDPIKARAHSAVNARVSRGKLIDPNDLPCANCGHVGSDRRHEYHHANGYDGASKFEVTCLCSRCHAKERKNGAH
jgi:hypothetical protein